MCVCVRARVYFLFVGVKTGTNSFSVCLSGAKLTWRAFFVFFFHLMQQLLSADVWRPTETHAINNDLNGRGAAMNTKKRREKPAGRQCQPVNNVKSYDRL